jgi:hypothetical protein
VSAAGYSGTPLPRNLGIRPASRLVLSRAPARFDATLGELPDDVRVLRLPAARAAIRPDGGLWVAWPKRASGVSTDITEDVVREVGVSAGLVDNTVCALDETWSGLGLVVRLRDRGA